MLTAGALAAVLLLLLGLALGAVLGYLSGRSAGSSAQRAEDAAALARLEAEVQAERERREVEADMQQQALEAARAQSVALHEQTLDQFKGLSSEALATATEQLLTLAEQRLGTAQEVAGGDLRMRQQAVSDLVKPVQEALAQVSAQVAQLEKQREGHAADLARQIEQVHTASEGVRRETASLVAALRKPQTRGAWGELHLQRAVELAGLLERVDYVQQPTADGQDGAVRPDMVVNLVGGKKIVVDSKVPLEAFLRAHEADDDDERERLLAQHAAQLKTHVDGLSAKAYWSRFSPSPEFVVMFVPGESFLSAALQADPTLLEHAFRHQIIIATPTTMVGLLRTVAYAWTQEALAANAQRVLDVAKELVTRLDKLSTHLGKVGRGLATSVNAYNDAVGSYERRVLVTARQFADLEVTDSALEPPTQLEVAPRVVAEEQQSLPSARAAS